MGRIAIVTDSTADIPREVVEAQGIYIIPLKILFGQQEFSDGVDITPLEFYRKLRESSALPTTSQPSAGDFCKLYGESIQAAESIISIHLSAELSGTLESAHAARAQLDSPVPIHIVDSRTTSMGLGFMALAAAQMVASGLDAPKIVEQISALIPRMNVLFAVDTLEYLHKGGRIGGAERLLGSILRIKPLLEITDGKVEALDKARTKPRAVARLLDMMEARVSGADTVYAAVMHGDAEQEALAVREEIGKRFPCRELYLCDLCPALGVHTGPGLLGVAFYTEE